MPAPSLIPSSLVKAFALHGFPHCFTQSTLWTTYEMTQGLQHNPRRSSEAESVGQSLRRGSFSEHILHVSLASATPRADTAPLWPVTSPEEAAVMHIFCTFPFYGCLEIHLKCQQFAITPSLVWLNVILQRELCSYASVNPKYHHCHLWL